MSLLPRHRIVEVPLAGGVDASGLARLTALRRSLLPALAAAHASGRAFGCCWARSEPGGPVQVLVSERPDDAGAIAYSPGARAEPADPSALAAIESLPAWIGCAGGHDTLTTLPESDADPLGVLEDLLPQLGTAPFGWLVLARPLDPAGLLDDLHHRITIGLDRQNVSGREALELERDRARFRDFSAAAGGLWQVQVLAGGPDPDAALAVAGLLSGTADLHTTAYVVRPDAAAGSLAEATAAARVMPATGELLAAVARPPVRELPGIRAIEQAPFDLTPETGTGGVPLGEVLDPAGRAVAPLSVPLATLNRHAFVAGATGSGKSQTIRHLLEGLHAAEVPWLVVEPAKAEYAAMAGRLPPGAGVAVIRPGDPDAIPLSLNPLEPEAGFPLQTHLDLVRALFLAAFEAHEPFPQVLSQALTRSYTDLGWDLALSEGDGHYPTLDDLQTHAREVVADIGYGAELAADVRGFVDVRLQSLRLGTTGRFLGAGHRLDVADLLRRNVVLELEDIGDDQDKAFCMGVVLVRLVEHLRVRHAAGQDPRGLRHVTVIEEAHRLLKATAVDSPAAHAVEMFAGLLAEIRAYGEGIVVAEQIPSKVLPDVVKNTALKVLHRLPAADDRETVGATMNLDPVQSRAVVSLPPGRAAVFTDGMDRPVLAQIPYGEDREKREPSPPAVKVSGRRGSGCGAVCLERPCTQREISAAVTEADADQRLVLWIELLTVAHLTGNPRPVPRDDSLAVIAGLPDRLRQCTIGEAVTRAVESRRRPIQGCYLPERLAAHLAQVAERFLRGGELCEPGGEESGWRPESIGWASTPLLFGEDTGFVTTVARLSETGTLIDRLGEATAFLTLESDWHLDAYRPISEHDL